VIHWAVEAVGEWYETTLGISWLEQCHRGLGTPFVDIQCDHLSPIVPGDELELAVAIARLGQASIVYEVVGRGRDGAARFRARMTACHIHEEGRRAKPTPFPEEMRRRIEGYRKGGG
jgi:acyl-CoA thioesterase FadM